MKDANDKQTADLLPMPKKRGRPATGKALTPAQKQAAYRARQAENKATVTINKADLKALKRAIALVDFFPELSPEEREALSRVESAIYQAG